MTRLIFILAFLTSHLTAQVGQFHHQIDTLERLENKVYGLISTYYKQNLVETSEAHIFKDTITLEIPKTRWFLGLFVIRDTILCEAVQIVKHGRTVEYGRSETIILTEYHEGSWIKTDYLNSEGETVEPGSFKEYYPKPYICGNGIRGPEYLILESIK